MTTAISTDTLTRQQLLAEVPMFARLETPVLEALARGCAILRLENGEIVALEGDTDVPVFVVAEGDIVGYRVGADGRPHTLVRLQRGAPFYIPCALGTRSRAPVSTRAVVPSTVLSFPQRVFRSLVHTHHALAIAVLVELSNKCDRYVRLAGDVRTLGVRERLALLLLQAAEGQDPPTVFATHETLAMELCSAREVVSRHLSELAQDGAVELFRGRIVIADASSLLSTVKSSKSV